MSLAIQAFGAPVAPYDLSMILKDLGISHSVHVKDRKNQIPYIKHVASTQPYWVAVISKVQALNTAMPKKPYVLFICDSVARLKTCNVGLLPFNACNANTIKEALVYAQNHRIENGWRLNETSPSIDDFVSVASNPSFLNFMETVRQKINPYDLRKAVQPYLIAYLDSRISLRKLMEYLKRSHKYERLIEVIKDPQAKNLRDAVEFFKNNRMDSEAVGDKFGIDSFDINYILKASANFAKNK